MLAVLLGVDLAAGQPLGQDVLGAGPWLLAGLSLLVGRTGLADLQAGDADQHREQPLHLSEGPTGGAAERAMSPLAGHRRSGPVARGRRRAM